MEPHGRASGGDFKRLDDMALHRIPAAAFPGRWLADGSAVRRFADLDDMADLAECIRKQET
jgi:hypothetical protein